MNTKVTELNKDMDFDSYMNSLGMEETELKEINEELDDKVNVRIFQKKMSENYDMSPKGWRVKNKIGRNQKVTITKGGESKVMKYKKVESLLNDGWTLNMEVK